MRQAPLEAAARAGAVVPSPAQAASRAGASNTPALLGGTPVRRTPFPSWPVADALEEDALVRVIRSGKWNRGDNVSSFESAYAALTGAKDCLATANGTSALIVSLAALGIGPGDEVIVPPYTFVATINSVLLMRALPVFVDTDPDTFQIDARKVERCDHRPNEVDPAGAPRRHPPRSRHDSRGRAPARRHRGRGRVPGASRRVARAKGRHVWGDRGASAFRRARI